MPELKWINAPLCCFWPFLGKLRNENKTLIYRKRYQLDIRRLGTVCNSPVINDTALTKEKIDGVKTTVLLVQLPPLYNTFCDQQNRQNKSPIYLDRTVLGGEE